MSTSLPGSALKSLCGVEDVSPRERGRGCRKVKGQPALLCGIVSEKLVSSVAASFMTIRFHLPV